jgi:hypothetical protein
MRQLTREFPFFTGKQRASLMAPKALSSREDDDDEGYAATAMMMMRGTATTATGATISDLYGEPFWDEARRWPGLSLQLAAS